MKSKCLAAVIMFVAFASSVFGAVTVDWAASGGTSWLYDNAGKFCGEVTDNWYAELVVDQGNDNSWNTILSNYRNGTWSFGTYSDTDYAVDNTLFAMGSSGWSKSTDIGNANAGKRLYMLFYNNQVRASATEIGIAYDSSGTLWVAPGVDVPMGSPHELFGASPITGTQADQTFGTPGAAGRWYTVTIIPEPGTMALFALGALVGGVRMRKRIKG